MLLLAVTPAFASGRNVVFVDSARAGGVGTYEKPFATIAEASRVSGPGTIIYVAEAPERYEEGVTLAKGQMLVGSAFGLDAVRLATKVEIDAPPLPAATGTGPVIHGMVTLTGDNLIAGCTLVADRKVGVALASDSPQGAIMLRQVYVRTSTDAWALYVNNNLFPLEWSGGAVDAAEHGSGILINGGNANVTFDHVAINGEFGDGIAVRGRTGGIIAFRNAPIKIRDASRNAVEVSDSKGAIFFDSPLQIATNGGRGLFSNNVQNLGVSAGSSWIEAINAPALTIHNSGAQIALDHVSADGELTDGIVIDKARGKIEINGGSIRNAQAYGVRITQSSDIHMRGIDIAGGGVLASTEECPEDVIAKTNVKCRAGLYLRHVERSSFETITIDDNGGVGLNANNLVDTTFADVKINRVAGVTMLVDEARGKVTFARCAFPSVVIAQRFNQATLIFDRCDIGSMEVIASEQGTVCVDIGGGPKPAIHTTGKNAKLGGCN